MLIKSMLSFLTVMVRDFADNVISVMRSCGRLTEFEFQ